MGLTMSRLIAIISSAVVLAGLSTAAPVLAENLAITTSPTIGVASTDLCTRYDSVWSQRQAAYERAREIRKKAFEVTKTRWGKLFDKLDAKNISTLGVGADADEVVNKFGALVTADDSLMAAIKAYGKAVCTKSGVDDARKLVKSAQDGRRKARQAHVKSLRQLAADLVKLRKSGIKTSTTGGKANLGY